MTTGSPSFPGDTLWWTGFRKIDGEEMRVDEHTLELLDKIGGKILEGPLFFKGPQEETKSVVSSQKKVFLMGKERTLDAGLAKITMLVSADLGLNELQAYCLLKQYAKQQQIDSKQLMHMSSEQRLEVMSLYFTERRALLSCLLGAVRLRKICKVRGDPISKRINEKFDDLDAKGWSTNIVNSIALSIWPEDDKSRVVTLEIEELQTLLETLTLYYAICPPSGQSIVELVRAFKSFLATSTLADVPWPLLVKVWHLFLVALDFGAMLACASSSALQSHRLTGSLKVIDAEVQELKKTKNNSVGILFVTWALFIGVGKRCPRVSQERNKKNEEGSLDPFPYFAAVREDYIFGCMKEFVEASEQSSHQHLIHQDILFFMASLVIVAQSLLSDHSSLYNLLGIVMHLLEGSEDLCTYVVSAKEFSGIRDLVAGFQNWFPALPAPYLRILTVLCHLRTITTLVAAFKLPSLTLEHDRSDRNIQSFTGRIVEAIRPFHKQGIEIEQGCQGQIVSCPLSGCDSFFVKWEKTGTIFDVLEFSMARLLSEGSPESLSAAAVDGVNDMLAFYARVMGMPNWIRVIGACVPESIDSPMLYHQKWITFAGRGIDWFAGLRENQPLANCLIILGNYAMVYPTLVARATRETTYLNKMTDKRCHIHYELMALGSHKENIRVVSEYLNLMSALVAGGVVEGIINDHVESIMEFLPKNHILWSWTNETYEELRKSMVKFIATSISSSSSKQNGIAARVLKDTVYSKGVLKILFDGLPSCEKTPNDRMILRRLSVAETHLSLIKTLISINSEIDSMIGEVLLGVSGRMEMSRCARLLAVLVVPRDRMSRSFSIAALHMRTKSLAIPVLTSLLKISTCMRVPVKLDSLLPTNNDEQDSLGASEFQDFSMMICSGLEIEQAKLHPHIFQSTIELLVQAGEHHPEVLSILLSSSSKQENNERGILQSLLDIVVDGKNLMKSNPQILYECVRAIHSLWVHRIARPGPVTSLTVESKFWKSLVQFLQDMRSPSTNHFNLATAGYILQILVMESRDGWSGCSRSESNHLWDSSILESLWWFLRELYADCDLPLSNAGNLLSAANEVALDILRAATEFAPDARMQLVEDLENILMPGMEHTSPDDKMSVIAQLFKTATSDKHQHGGQALLLKINERLKMWETDATSWVAAELHRHDLAPMIPEFLTGHCHSMETLMLLLNEARWLGALLRCKIAAVNALHQLAANKWTDSSVPPVSPQVRAAILVSTADVLPPWVQLSVGHMSSAWPSLLPSQALSAQVQEIQQQAICMADVIAMGLNFFAREWCNSVSSTQPMAQRQLQSPSLRRNSVGSPAGARQKGSDDFPSKDALLSFFSALNVVCEALEERQNMRLWMKPPHTMIGSVLSALSSILSEYPFPRLASGAREVPLVVQTALSNRTIEALCWMVASDGVPEDLVAESLMCLGVLQEFNIWSTESIFLLQDQLNIEDLVLRATASIPSFSLKKRKVSPTGHWSSAALRFVHFVAKSSWTRSVLLTPDALVTILDYGRSLLDPRIGGLGTNLGYSIEKNKHAQPVHKVNFRGAYDLETRAWRIEHKQWLLFVAVIEQIVTSPEGCDSFSKFRGYVATEFQTALIKALEFPVGTYHEPVTHAQLLETIAMLQFALAIWRFCNPMSLMEIKAAVVRYLETCAQRLCNPVFMSCSPVSFEEQEAANDAPPIACHHGWFRNFARDIKLEELNDSKAAGQKYDILSQGIGVQENDRNQPSSGDVLQTPQHLVLHRLESHKAFGNWDSELLNDQDKGSRYTFSLGESMYNVINCLLRFLLVTSPTAVKKEAAGMGSTWPSKVTLLSVSQDCLSLAENISHWELDDNRVLHLVLGLRDSIQMSNELLDLQGYTHQSRDAELVENRLVDMDRCIGQH